MKRIPALILFTILVGCSSSDPAASDSDDDPIDGTTPDVQVTEDLTFAEGQQIGVQDQALDVHALTAPEEKRVAVLLHGGSGDRKQFVYQEVARGLAGREVVVFVPSYAGGNPTQVFARDGRGLRERLETVECAIKYARAHAAEYGGDPTHITVIGQSAGGFLGALITLIDGESAQFWEDMHEISVSPPNQMKCLDDSVPSNTAGFVGFNGAYFVFSALDVEQDYADIVSIESYMGRNPALTVRFILGSEDTQTPAWHVDRTHSFISTLKDAGYDAESVTVTAGHNFDVSGPGWSPTLSTMLEAVQGGAGGGSSQ